VGRDIVKATGELKPAHRGVLRSGPGVHLRYDISCPAEESEVFYCLIDPSRWAESECLDGKHSTGGWTLARQEVQKAIILARVHSSLDLDISVQGVDDDQVGPYLDCFLEKTTQERLPRRFRSVSGVNRVEIFSRLFSDSKRAQ
jgi:hypothetical protein